MFWRIQSRVWVRVKILAAVMEEDILVGKNVDNDVMDLLFDLLCVYFEEEKFLLCLLLVLDS